MTNDREHEPVLTRINDETGHAIGQDEWERHEWINVTTMNDPPDVRRYVIGRYGTASRRVVSGRERLGE